MKSYISSVFALVLLLNFLHAQAATPIDEKAVLAVLDATVKEHRVYATCFALEKTGRALEKDMWNKSRMEALDHLKSHQASLLLAAKFSLASELSKLFDPDMTLASAMTYCDKNAVQIKQFYVLNITDLASEVNKVLQNK
jgi:hypothetical protein